MRQQIIIFRFVIIFLLNIFKRKNSLRKKGFLVTSVTTVNNVATLSTSTIKYYSCTLVKEAFFTKSVDRQTAILLELLRAAKN